MSHMSRPIMYGSKCGFMIDGSLQKGVRILNTAGRLANSHAFALMRKAAEVSRER